MAGKLQHAMLGAMLFAGAGHVLAAGFAIIEHSAQGMGNAFAGGGAVAEDASTLWFNPASMSRLGSRFQASGHIVIPSFEFTNKGSTAAGSGAALLSGLGGTTPAPQTGNGGSTALVPNMYYIRELSEKLRFGLGINAPFGLTTEYDANWMGRYQTIESEIIDINVNPALSYQLNSNLSLGAGVSVNYVHAKLTKAVDFAGVCLARVPAAARASCVGAAGGPGQAGNDGFAEVKGDDFSFGFNLGLMYEFNDDSRVSLAYRSQVKHTLDGKAEFAIPTTISSIAALDTRLRSGFVNSGVSAGLDLPDSFSISGYHRFQDSKFALMGDATWTGWSSVPGLLIVYDNPATLGGSSNEPLGWKDTWRLGLGLNYYHSPRLTLRSGVAWDESPVPGVLLRTPRLPGNDRTWLSIGASYAFNDRMSADFGYAHLFVDDTEIRHTDATGTLAGTYKSDVNIVSLQFNYQFD